MPRAKKSATVSVEEFVTETEQRLDAVAKQSLQELVEVVQQPMAKGGRMRIDTGFMRASGQGSLTGMPVGPSRPESDEPLHYDDGSEVPNNVVLTIARLDLGGRFYFGWTANYAKFREAKDAFLRLGVQRWSQIVASVATRLADRIGK
jgi:hypothetical protein